MRLTKADIPFENLFMVGINDQQTTRDAFVILAPRKPFVITRPEALNLIGHMMTQADLDTKQIESIARQWNKAQGDWFSIVADEHRALLNLPRAIRGPIHMKEVLLSARKIGLWTLSIDEGVTLIASLIVSMGLHPSEIDAALQATFEQPRGQETIEDMGKRVLKTTPN